MRVSFGIGQFIASCFFAGVVFYIQDEVGKSRPIVRYVILALAISFSVAFGIELGHQGG
jgi:hypothetical protein